MTENEKRWCILLGDGFDDIGTRRDERVVVSGNIVTAQALGASIEVALTLIELIASKAKKDEIASYYHI